MALTCPFCRQTFLDSQEGRRLAPLIDQLNDQSITVETNQPGRLNKEVIHG
jgi:hypothetical protein